MIIFFEQSVQFRGWYTDDLERWIATKPGDAETPYSQDLLNIRKN